MGIEIGGLLVLILDIWAIISTIRSPSGIGGKILWILLVIFLPLLGFILWLLFGPKASHGR